MFIKGQPTDWRVRQLAKYTTPALLLGFARNLDSDFIKEKCLFLFFFVKIVTFIWISQV